MSVFSVILTNTSKYRRPTSADGHLDEVVDVLRVGHEGEGPLDRVAVQDQFPWSVLELFRTDNMRV